jgi:hypothetical protein
MPLLLSVRVGCVLATCGMLLAACAGASSSNEPLAIAPTTNAYFQAYLETGDDSSSAFAVSEDGQYSFYSYCESGGCNGQYSFSREAIRGCEKLGHGRCVVLGSNGVVRRPYVVAGGSTSALPSQGMASDFVSGDRIRQELAGNSIVEPISEGKVWAEYFAPDGTLRGRTEDGRRFDGSWKIDGNTLCVDYRSIASDWCGQFAEGADGSIDYYRDGKFAKTYPRSVLQTGNPENL